MTEQDTDGQVWDEVSGTWSAAPPVAVKAKPMQHTGPGRGGLAAMGKPESAIPDSLFLVPKKDAYFVAYWGSDEGGDGSLDKPWRTINLAQKMAQVSSGLTKTAIVVLLKKP